MNRVSVDIVRKIMNEKPSPLFIVRIHCKGFNTNLSKNPETVFRPNKEDKNRLQYFKVKTYRILEKLSNFKLDEQYILSMKNLIVFEKEFQKIRREFMQFRKERCKKPPENSFQTTEDLSRCDERLKTSFEHVVELKPSEESFVDLNYEITPLQFLLNQIYEVYEGFKSLSEKDKEYCLLAERMRWRVEEMRIELKRQYDEKIRTLQEKTEMLRVALEEDRKEKYVLTLENDVAKLFEETLEIAELLDEEAVEKLDKLFGLLTQMGK